MKKLPTLITSLALTAAAMGVSHAATLKVVYGEDNRVFVEDSTNPLYQKLAMSTAVQIKDDRMSPTADGQYYSVNPEKLKDSFMNVCEDEDFAEVVNAGNCSGFLVGEDLLVTAGHCMRSEYDCKNAKWAFNYESSVLGDGTLLPAEDVYSCDSIVSQSLDYLSKNDYALIKLDRKVTGRAPLKVRTEGAVEPGTELVVIGHPSGLPKIVADGAQVREFKNDFYFKANLDTFGGNSGSAVFNAETGVVEGILVRGERDYIMDYSAGCNRVYECTDDGCRGEDVTRITVIPELAPGMTPEAPKTNLTSEQIAILSFFGM
mgnify:CR=1 FL=1